MAREPRGVREYSTDEVVVEWQPRLCFHSHKPFCDGTHKTNGFEG